MPSRFSSGKHAIAECDRCGFRYKLSELKNLVIKTKNVSIKVCQTCWEPDQPQLQLGLYPVNDPQAVREPRPDVSYYTAGPLIGGDGGSRVIQWGWNPVGNSNPLNLPNIINDLSATVSIGTVTAASIYISPPTFLLFGGTSPGYDGYNIEVYQPSIGFGASPDPTVIGYKLVIDGTSFDLVPSASGTDQYNYVFTNKNNALGVTQQLNTTPEYQVFQSSGYSYNTISLSAVSSIGAQSNPITLTGTSAQLPGNPSDDQYAVPTFVTSVYWTCGTPYFIGAQQVVDVTIGWLPPSDPGTDNGTIDHYEISILSGPVTIVNGLSTVVRGLAVANVTSISIYAVDGGGNPGSVYTLNVIPQIDGINLNRPSQPLNGWYVASAPYTPLGYTTQKIDITLNWTAPTYNVASVVNYEVTDGYIPDQSYGATTITFTYDYIPGTLYRFQIIAITAARFSSGPASDTLVLFVQT